MEFTINCDVSVILPAAGIGERLGATLPKQFSIIDGKPLLCYTIDAFENITWVRKIVVVLATKYEEYMKSVINKCKYSKVHIALGSYTRHRSIATGIKFLEDDKPEIVIIHDAVRPVVPTEIIRSVVLAAKEHKAAGPICPLTSTVVYKDENNFLNHSLDRQHYYASKTPQAFLYSLIKDAYAKCGDHDLNHGTECLHLVDKYCNVKAKLVEGSPDLWKVTYPKDLYAAEIILGRKMNPVWLSAEEVPEDVSNIITSTLKSYVNVNIVNDPIIAEELSNVNDLNLVIFHSGCQLRDLMTCCRPNFSSSKFLPRTTIHVILNQTTDLDFVKISQLMTNFTQNIGKSSLLYFIWKIKEAWSEENITQLTNIISELLLNKSVNFSGQIFTIC